MRLLFDHNLSHKLVKRLADVFPDSEHVRHVDLYEASDREIWEYARSRRLVIVSKDEDFHQSSFLLGPPPKVVWVRLGNCATRDIERALRTFHAELLAFDANEEGAFMAIGGADFTVQG